MTRFYNWLLKMIKPFVAWWATLHFPFTHKKITGKFYYRVRDDIDIGTVILTTTKGEFSNLLNLTKIKHAGVYLGKDSDGICYVTEALGKGVIKTDLVTFLTTKDVVVICKPNFIAPAFIDTVAQRIRSMIGIEYDYIFQSGDDKLYCFENAALAFKDISPPLKKTEIVRDKHIYGPDTFLDPTLFTIVHDSRTMKL